MLSANIVSAFCCFLSSLFFWGISIYSFTRKDPMHFWSGSKVMPEEIRDIPAYNRANALMWAIYAACMVLAGILSLFSVIAGVAVMLITIVPGIAVLIVVYKKIYNKYKNSSFTNTEIINSSPKGSKKSVINLIVTVLILIGLPVMFYYSEKEPEVIIHKDRIQIKGMYGLSIDLSEITDISLIEKSMKEIGVGSRTNGYGGFGDTLKGNFKSDTLGETILFVRANSAPTIKIERAGKKDIYISFNNAERTNLLYSNLIQMYAEKK